MRRIELRERLLRRRRVLPRHLGQRLWNERRRVRELLLSGADVLGRDVRVRADV
jgi:hypothetical protein